MSLLDNGPDTVTVYVQESTTDDYGNVVYVPSVTTVDVRGRMQPGGSSSFSSDRGEDASVGQVTEETYRFISRTFPANSYGKCVFEGREWDIVGAPKEHRGSSLTSHFTTYLRAREA